MGTETAPFEVGKTYLTQEGKSVTIRKATNIPSYECVMGDDTWSPEPGLWRYVWRYNRASDRGRVTGSAFDMSDPRNLIPEPLTPAGRAALQPEGAK